jgi:hypothetical protein
LEWAAAAESARPIGRSVAEWQQSELQSEWRIRRGAISIAIAIDRLSEKGKGKSF